MTKILKDKVMYQDKIKEQKGFTLIELLVTIVLLGVLSGMSVEAFQSAKGQAAYVVAEQTVNFARKSFEAALANPDVTYSNIVTSQTTQGPVTDASARALLPGFLLSPNIKFTIGYDNSCSVAGCLEIYFTARHCGGQEYIAWQRNGMGDEIMLDHVAGVGCP